MDDIHDPRREATPYATSLTNLEPGFPNWAHRNSFFAPSFETNFAKGQGQGTCACHLDHEPNGR